MDTTTIQDKQPGISASIGQRFDPSDMASRGRIGGLVRASRYGPQELTGPARIGFMARFYKDLPDGLSEQERDRRAQAALRAHMAQLARRSARARAK